MKRAVTILCLLTLVICVQSQTSLIEDFDYFFKQFEAVHPEPYKAFGGKDAFNKSKDSLRNSLKTTPELTESKMQQAVTTFLTPLHDEHTHFGYRSSGGAEYQGLPIHFRALPDGALMVDGIIGDKSCLGGIIQNIHGFSIDELLKRISRVAMAENKYGLLCRATTMLTEKTQLLSLLDIEDTDEIYYLLSLPDGRKVNVPLRFMTDAGMAKENIQKSPRDSRFPFDNLAYNFVDGKKQTMVIRLRNVTSEKIGSSFGEMLRMMKANGSRNLIIDLRDNGGGDTRLLYPALYEMYGKAFLKADMGMTYGSRISELYLKKHGLSLEKLNAGGSAFKLDDMLYEDTNHKDPQGARYIYTPKKVFVVCNEFTFSAAFHALLMFRAMGAVIVGVPSSQAPNTYMENTEFVLPNTGMKCSVSNSIQKCFSNDSPNARILQPDIQLTYQDYKKYGFDKNAELLYILDTLK